MKKLQLVLSGVSMVALASCALPGEGARTLKGIAPAGTTRVLAIDAEGLSFAATPDSAGAYTLQIASADKLSVFVEADTIRVLRMASAPGAPSTETLIPSWTGEVNVGQMSTCDCDEDGVDEDVTAEHNPLDDTDNDEDGVADSSDDDDDNDGTRDDEDRDHDGDGTDDHAQRHDDDDDGRPNLCDDDDDGDDTPDGEDPDHHDDDHDGVSDDDDRDRDGDGRHDDDGDDDHSDGDASGADGAGSGDNGSTPPPG